MIRHVVFFKLKEGLGPEQGKKLADALMALQGSTGGLMVECETGLDVVRGGNSYDLALNSVFRSVVDLEKYRVHPEHAKVLALVDDLCSKRRAVDYEIKRG